MYEQYNTDCRPTSSKNLLKCAVFSKNPLSYGLSKADRLEVAAAIVEQSAQELPKIRDRLRQESDRFCVCGQIYSKKRCHNDGIDFRIPRSCHSRICEVCGHRYAKRLKGKMAELFRRCTSKQVRGYGLFMLTLTTTTDRFDDRPGRDDIARLYRESGMFLKRYYGKYKCRIRNGKVVEDQRRIYYEGKVKKRYTPKIRISRKGNQVEDYRKFRGGGYMSSLELGCKGNMLHIHAIVYGPYISRKQLIERWVAITGDSWHVDIRPVRDPGKAANYVLKYIVKAPDVDSFSDLAAYAIAIKGSRRLRTGGIFYNQLSLPKRTRPDDGCPFCGNRLEYWGSTIIEDFSKSNTLPLYWLKNLEEEAGRLLPIPWAGSDSQETTDLIVQIVAKIM